MSESKQTDADEFLRSRAAVEVTAVDVSPNPAALADELNLEVDFTLDRPVLRGVWDIEVSARGLGMRCPPKSIFAGCARWRANLLFAASAGGLQYLVDSVTKRHVINIPPTVAVASVLPSSSVLAACCVFHPHCCSLNLAALPADASPLPPPSLHSSDRCAPRTTRAVTTTSSSRWVHRQCLPCKRECDPER